MKKRLSNRSLQLALIFILLSIASGIVYIVQNHRYSVHNPSQLIKRNSKQDVINECWANLEYKLAGKWKEISSEIPVTPTLYLYPNKKFKIEYENTDSLNISGKWEYILERNSIKFKFLEYDDQWINILNTDLSMYGNDTLYYSFEEKELELRINYILVGEDVEELAECKEDNFSINMFNVYLYKSNNY